MKFLLAALALATTAVTARGLVDRIPHLSRDLAQFQPKVASFQHASGPHKRDVQQPLISPTDENTNGVHHIAGLEIECALFWGLLPFYWTNIAIGTPNQAFRMILDLSYGGLLVRSPDCGWNGPEIEGCGGGFAYWSNHSSTYTDKNETFFMQLPAHTAYGRVSKDHVQLVGLNITDVVFGEVDQFSGENFVLLTMEHYADG
jgi:hypothetical protein